MTEEELLKRIDELQNQILKLQRINELAFDALLEAEKMNLKYLNKARLESYDEL